MTAPVGPGARPLRAPGHDDADELAELAELGRTRAIARTGLQVGIPAALVGIGSWLARLHGIDLDPEDGVDLPADVAGYLVAVLTGALAWAMNRKPKTGP